jgi:hypothetical protein
MDEIIKSCIEILKEVGKNICNGKETYITSFVTETSQDNQIKAFALYIIAPEISYEYRAISVDVLSRTELKVNFHTLKTQQTQPFNVNVLINLNEYNSALSKITSNSLFKYSIEFITNQIDLKKEYKYPPIKDQIIAGQARIAKIKDIGEIPVGFIRVENNLVYYYTGQGLRTMWKPNMTEDEKKIADELKGKDEKELIRLKHIESRDINEFIEIK